MYSILVFIPIVTVEGSTLGPIMIAEGSHAAGPTRWGPCIDRKIVWGWESYGIVLTPNSVQSFDTISRLKLVQETTRLVLSWVTQACGFKKEYIKVGRNGVITLALTGRPRGFGRWYKRWIRPLEN